MPNFMTSIKTRKIEFEKPIFIVGAPRSGTSLLYRFLAQHNDLGWFSHNTVKNFLTEKFLRFISLRRRIFGLNNIPYPIGGFNPRFFSTIESPVEGGLLWDLVFQGDWDASISEQNLNIIKKTIKEILANKKKKRFLSKYPRNSIKIPLIDQAFPNSKFIHIVRDGRAVVNSMIRRSGEDPSGYFGIPLKTNDIQEMNKIQKHSVQWVQVIESIRNDAKYLQPDQFFEVKYEDLVRNTEECLDKITRFSDLPPSNYAYIKDGITKNIENKEPFCWELMTLEKIENKNLSHENDSEIEKYISNTLKDLGYT